MVIPPAVRAELMQHAQAEAPNEACGLIVFQDGVASRYERGRNAAMSPRLFQMEIDPEIWFLDDPGQGIELAMFHSHPTAEARPSPTDVANIGLWEGRPYFVLSRPTGILGGFTIKDGVVTELAFR